MWVLCLCLYYKPHMFILTNRVGQQITGREWDQTEMRKREDEEQRFDNNNGKIRFIKAKEKYQFTFKRFNPTALLSN